MAWTTPIIDRLAELEGWGYRADGPAFSEPVALAAMALMAHGKKDAARRGFEWLVALQKESKQGSVGIAVSQREPAWTTSLAVLAWSRDRDAYAEPIGEGMLWIQSIRGTTGQHKGVLGHDSTLEGWPWVNGTHSWYEPTAFAYLAYKATGRRNDARAKVAVQLLIDRLLPAGGCNYGNTIVLNNTLRPHVQPSGIALLALCEEKDASGRLDKTVDYVRSNLQAGLATASLCWGLLGLAAQRVETPDADAWLRAAAKRTMEQGGSPHKLALLALAALGRDCPLVNLTWEKQS